jgi:hypothetical protein
VSFATITLRVVSQRVFIVVVYFVIDSVRKLLDIPSYIHSRIRVEGVDKFTLALEIYTVLKSQ